MVLIDGWMGSWLRNGSMGGHNGWKQLKEHLLY